MSNFNQTTLIGRLGKNPQIHHFNGGQLAALNIATSKRWTDKKTGELREKTSWHRCVCYNKQAEYCEKYLQKGDLVFVAGELEYRQWQDDYQQTRFSPEIQVQTLRHLSPKNTTNGIGTTPTTPANHNAQKRGNNPVATEATKNTTPTVSPSNDTENIDSIEMDFPEGLTIDLEDNPFAVFDLSTQ